MVGSSSRAPARTSQERIVLQRSYNKCAYPDCGADLVFDAEAPLDLGKSVGKIAHIRAASAGGPRYDADMTDLERAAAANLLVLCGEHHDVIDTQLFKHTVEFLTTAKQVHESVGYRAVRHALGEIGYAELEAVCTTLGAMDEPAEPVDLPIAVDQKIALNLLTGASAQQIKDGLAQSGRVSGYIEFQGLHSDGFGRRLAARLKVHYFEGLAEGLSPDDVFNLIVLECQENSGPIDSPEMRAAALAVVAYYFEICEIFEHDATVA